MYFYTKIKKIGEFKTDRSVKLKKGHWKPTQAPKPIRGKTGKIIGSKTSLAYYNEDNRKTQWLMKEYKLEYHNSHHSSHKLVVPSHNSHRSNERVVAVIYFYRRRGRGDDDDDDGENY